MEAIREKLENRIQERGRGTVFTPREFLELGSRAAVDQALSRLARQGKIRRLTRGVYDYPQVSEFLGLEVSPTPEVVARAVARKTEGRLQLTGAQAANVLGLSEQVPARVAYLTDGRSRRVKIGKQTIEFRHTAARYMAMESKVGALVVHALRHLGGKHVDETTVQRLRMTLSAEDKQSLAKDARHAPDWIRTVIAQVVE
ncbi:MAG: hypothetical protein JWQ02_2227 [Capsulimonas sp.]|nr:hypothetical protein [Capsulimonas sp.]